jgi:hypothetical protein
MTLSNVLGRPRKYHLDKLMPGDTTEIYCDGLEDAKRTQCSIISSARNAFGAPGYVKTRMLSVSGKIWIKVQRVK